MRIVLLTQMDQILGLHYAIALHRRGHHVTAIHVEEPDGTAESLPELSGIEILTPYRGGRKHVRRHYLAWAAADRFRNGPAAYAFRRFARGIDREAVSRVARDVAGRQPDLVLGMWGLNAYPEVLALLRVPGRRFPIFYDWNIYPLGDDPPGARGLNPIDREILLGVEGRVHSSALALAYIKERTPLPRGVDLILPDGFTDLARARQTPALLSAGDGQPHLIYHGNWRVHPGGQDDVLPILKGLADAGIHVHYPDQGPASPHPLLHAYPPFTIRDHLSGAFLEFTLRFDAGLVLYHIPKPFARYANYLPTRLLSLVSAGLPVVLPRGYLAASQEFLAEHGNGLLFEDSADLRRRLLDPAVMTPLRQRAAGIGKTFSLESRLGALEDAVPEAARFLV